MHEYFAGIYRRRLKTLKDKVHFTIPSFRDKPEEFEVWLKTELEYFLTGTRNQVKDVRSLDKKYAIMITFEFIAAYLENKLSEQDIDEWLAS